MLSPLLPDAEDIFMTKWLMRAGEIMGIGLFSFTLCRLPFTLGCDTMHEDMLVSKPA